MSMDSSFDNFERLMYSLDDSDKIRDNTEGQYVLDPIVQESEVKQPPQNPANNGKTYGQLIEIVQRLNDINWVEPQSKITPIKYLTPITYWFIICSQYFQKDTDPKIIKEKIEEEYPSHEEDKPYTFFDDWFVMEMRNIVNFNLRQMVKRIITLQ